MDGKYIKIPEGGEATSDGKDYQGDQEITELTTQQRYIKILKFSIPAIIACFVTRVQDTINLMFLGHLGDSKLISGIGLGHNYLQLMGMLFTNGILLALDTLNS
jgi:Na+-driven multidrug efflux pump